ncbi:MAG: glycosyltransferase family 39 protein [Flavobacteriales bacterium]|nr:glycosyltransferase family 39 protein [Flavobacteriales bacterium]
MRSARFSLYAVLITGSVLLWTRFEYSEYRGWSPMKVTQWDALGYYQYLPAVLIYGDIERQAWLEGVDSVYQLSGGSIYQVTELPNGNRATKYFCGLSLLQAPFFAVGHVAAGASGARQDGFSWPYQWAIGLSPLFYVLVSLLLLRTMLLRYFSDVVVAVTVILLVLATNAIQYISVDNTQTHGYLFALYAAQLYFTQRWHERPSAWYALAIGGLIGLATVSRPTEALMLFIPLLWNTHEKEASREKWALVRAHLPHVAVAAFASFIAFFPQLLYWKVVTGSWVYDVGSKWDFLNPHWRVLVGGEKGWFIYTPITIFLVLGLFFMRKQPWRKSVLVFTLLNTWVIIAWHDWHYGGSYSSRALVQGYPVLALPFSALLERSFTSRWRWPALALCSYLLMVNLFQIKQYNNTVIHYDRMNFEAYWAVYLDADPTEADRALLDPPRR